MQQQVSRDLSGLRSFYRNVPTSFLPCTRLPDQVLGGIMLVIKCWFYVEPLMVGGFFLKLPFTLMSDCKMLIWGYQLVVQCLRMKYAQVCSELNKTLYLTASPAELPLDMKDFLQTWSVFTVGLKLALLTSLPSCGMPLVRGRVLYGSVAAFWRSCS